MFRRAFGWLDIAEHIGERLTMPRTDICTSDRECEQLFLDSALWSSGEHVSRNVTAAWLDSWLRRWTRAAARTWVASDPVLVLRAIGWLMTVASVTTLGLQAIASPREPLVWIVPIAAAAGGVVLSWTGGRTRAAGRGTS
jgi:hypothetical protein